MALAVAVVSLGISRWYFRKTFSEASFDLRGILTRIYFCDFRGKEFLNRHRRLRSERVNERHGDFSTVKRLV
jgi:hypothetical protein